MWLSERFTGWLSWLTESQKNLRSMAILRIIYGVGLLLTFVPSIPDRSLLWGFASFWVDPESKRRGYFTFDLLLPKGNPIVFDIMFFAMIALTVVFLVGYRTRVVTPVLLLMIVSWQSNNMFMTNGGDTILRITLLFLLLANLSEYYSVDSWLRRRRGSSEEGKRFIPAHVSNAAHNTALVLCCFQIIVVYVVSGVWKLTGDDWPSGQALYYALRIESFAAYPAINELLWQSSLMIYLATFIALWVQTLFPLALLWRPSRIFVLVSLVFMHSGIGILLGLWPFSLAMIALDMLFIRDSTWVSATAWIRSTRAWGYLEVKVLGSGVKTRGRPLKATRPAPEPEPTSVS